MKHKPNKVNFSLRPTHRKVRKTFVWAVAITLLASASPAFATAGSTRVITPTPIYPACYYFCPNCCRTPGLEIQGQFRGPSLQLGAKPLNDRYLDNLWPLMQAKIAQISNAITQTIVKQSTARGALIDAQNNNRALGALQKSSAATANNYTPSEALCRFATLSQGLAASEADTEALKQILIKGSIDRQLMRTGAVSADDTTGEDGKEVVTMGQSADKKSRWEKYVSTFCNPDDFIQGKGTDGVCKTSSDQQYDMDINFARTLADPLTLDIGSETVTKDMENVTALSQNLYAHDILNNLPQPTTGSSGDAENTELRKYMLLRSVIAKRAIAENSFASLAAMKAKGTPATAEATQNLMVELGISADEAKKFVGDNPSYYAQMEALTRKLYESPSFYVNLMEKPINVKRQQASMKSLELMQQRDMYKSFQRSEMLMATLLEIYLSRSQGGLDKQQVQNR